MYITYTINSTENVIMFALNSLTYFEEIKRGNNFTFTQIFLIFLFFFLDKEKEHESGEGQRERDILTQTPC